MAHAKGRRFSASRPCRIFDAKLGKGQRFLQIQVIYRFAARMMLKEEPESNKISTLAKSGVLGEGLDFDVQPSKSD